jgi:hypothetical protein
MYKELAMVDDKDKKPVPNHPAPPPPHSPSASQQPARPRGTVGGIKVASSHDERIAALEKELETEKKKKAAQIDPQMVVGELGHGEMGFLVLDEEGHPQGTATKEPPPVGTPAARVVGYNPTMDPIATPSGAPITEQMNPAPDFRDPGLEERNPTPNVPFDLKGRPVVNTPVRY